MSGAGISIARPVTAADILLRLTGAATVAAGSFLVGQGTATLVSTGTGLTYAAGGLVHVGAAGITSRQAATQDAIQLLGRAGGSSTRSLTLTPATLTASRTVTFPDATITAAGINLAQTWSATQTFATIDATTIQIAGTNILDRSNTWSQAQVASRVASGTGFQINRPTDATFTDTIWSTGNSARWILRMSTAEPGADAGGDLDFLARTDGGAGIGTILRMARAAGAAVQIYRPLAFTDATLWITRTASNVMSFATASTERLEIGATGIVTVMNTDDASGSDLTSGAFHVVGGISSEKRITGALLTGLVSDAATNTRPTALEITHITSGTPAAGFGTATAWQAESTTTTRSQARLETEWTDATDATRKAQAKFYVYDTSTRAAWEAEANGTKVLLRLNGTVSTTDTTDVSAIGTAGFVALGGASVSKSLWVGGTAGNHINIANATGELRVNGTKVVAARNTGWTAQTAGASKADLGAAPTVGQLASFCRSLYDALAGHGLIGT